MLKKSEWIGHHDPVNAHVAGKAVMSVLLLLLAYRWYAGRFTSLLAGAPIMNPELDNTFWMVLATGLPACIIKHEALAASLDILVIATALWAYSSPERKMPVISFIVFFFLQTVINEAYSSQHSKTVVCIFIALLPFCFDGGKWLRMWEFARYYLIFVMVASALYKLFNGALFDPGHFSKTLVYQHADILTLHPDGLQGRLVSFLISHEKPSFFFFLTLFAVQSSFLPAFFTRKFDRILVLLLLVFCSMSYVLMRIYNFDLIILAVPLWYSFVMPKGMVFAGDSNTI